MVGDEKTVLVHFGHDGGGARLMTGTVVYIHPKRRFYVVEVDTGNGLIRESYYFPNRGGNE